MIEYNCDWCGGCSSKYPYEYNEDGHNFCDRDCYLSHHDNTEEYTCHYCNDIFERASSQVRGERAFCSQSCRGQWMSDERRGEDSYNWSGGTPERSTDARYQDWRADVLERDNYTCQDCGKRGGTLTAHHIERWSDAPDLRYEMDNGVTLCQPCHAERHHGEPVYSSLRSRAGMP